MKVNTFVLDAKRSTVRRSTWGQSKRLWHQMKKHSLTKECERLIDRQSQCLACALPSNQRKQYSTQGVRFLCLQLVHLGQLCLNLAWRSVKNGSQIETNFVFDKHVTLFNWVCTLGGVGNKLDSTWNYILYRGYLHHIRPRSSPMLKYIFPWSHFHGLISNIIHL